ncbi:hypothetical protein MOJ79_12150 [Calidifontimicrobium sp. SYSU G02091]|uniref:hypothetical protein n=1 Tax=Calidifontimicrobium sp. SYSU G02091 TaxID=2926421 RepID=UPI001F531F62|nr:hypothetical protein [Calidifontimicrobium sp. SYSU G02091]MCI1192596.1 hypothetical protein [Calidifontimicrobium sp. SYSU G02091]
MKDRIYADRVLVRCESHRARKRLFGLIGRRPRGWVSFCRHLDKRVFEVPADRLDDALQINGMRRARWSNDLTRPVSD